MASKELQAVSKSRQSIVIPAPFGVDRAVIDQPKVCCDSSCIRSKHLQQRDYFSTLQIATNERDKCELPLFFINKSIPLSTVLEIREHIFDSFASWRLNRRQKMTRRKPQRGAHESPDRQGELMAIRPCTRCERRKGK